MKKTVQIVLFGALALSSSSFGMHNKHSLKEQKYRRAQEKTYNVFFSKEQIKRLKGNKATYEMYRKSAINRQTFGTVNIILSLAISSGFLYKFGDQCFNIYDILSADDISSIGANSLLAAGYLSGVIGFSSLCSLCFEQKNYDYRIEKESERKSKLIQQLLNKQPSTLEKK